MSSLITIGDHLDEGYAVTAHCAIPGPDGCGHSAELDLDALAKQLGRDFKLSHWTLTPKLRCDKCRSKKVTIRVHNPSHWRAMAPTVANGKVEHWSKDQS
jgi:hypothetical protein